MDTASYKCPSCGAPLKYSAESGKMHCDYCGSDFEVSVLEQFNAAQDKAAQQDPQWQARQKTEGQAEELNGMVAYVCSNCGAQLLASETQAAMHCPYCDNEVIFNEQVSGMLRPDYVLPFRITQQQAQEALRGHCQRKPLLPKRFVSENRLEEIKGIYVPFWLYDCDTQVDATYDAQRIRTWSDSQYNYTETSHFLCTRKGSIGFDSVPVDGSSKMDDAFMDSVEPFDYSEFKTFGTAYLSGFLAEKYDMDDTACAPRANMRIRNSAQEAFASTVVGYSSVMPMRTDINMQNGSVHYALMPVWMLTTNYGGKKYRFAMNGQTGKFIGELPVSWPRYFAFLGGITAAISAIGFAVAAIL